MEAPQPRTWVYWVFGTSCAGCVLLMILQKIWRIRYNGEWLVFRNSFGRVRRYPMSELCIRYGENENKLLCRGGEITGWPPPIMDIIGEIELGQAICASRQKNRHIND